jgi:hypothetical protein
MSYAALIDSKLNLAFNTIKDLAVPVTFIKKTGTSFDFGTGATVHTTTTNIVTKAVIVDEKKTSKSTNTKTRQMMFKSKPLGDISLYDSVLIGADTWKLGDVISNSGYIILTNIYKD